MCFRESDGGFLWQILHEKLPDTQQNDWPQQGVASTPAVDGDRVYYVSNRCELVCAGTEPAAGQASPPIHWRLDMVKDLQVFPRYLANSSPLIVGDHVHVVTGHGVDDDNKVPTPTGASFVCADKRTGKVVWKSDAPGDKIMEGQWSNPAYAEVNGRGQAIFPGGDGWLRGFDAKTGELIWKFDCNPKSAEHKPGGRGTRNDFLATPVVVGTRVYVGTGQNPDHGDGLAYLWCIDVTKTGDISAAGDDLDPKSPANKNSGLVWAYGGKADAKYEGETNRSYFFGRTLSTCAVHDGLVYAADLAGFIYCLDAETGKRLWYHDTKADIWGSPYWVDGKVYLGNHDGDVYVFTHGREKKEPTTVEVKQPIKGTVVVANGVLYVLTDAQLYAIANK
jgi:outer membrane protein assembly factor BamB